MKKIPFKAIFIQLPLAIMMMVIVLAVALIGEVIDFFRPEREEDYYGD
jgi:predicted membrane channel-forming protein YqfA (hemolysin III family)